MSVTPRFDVLLRSEHGDGQVGIVEIDLPGTWPTIVVGPQIGSRDDG